MLYAHLIAHSTDTGRLSQPGPVFKCLGVLKKEETKLKHIALGGHNSNLVFFVF